MTLSPAERREQAHAERYESLIDEIEGVIHYIGQSVTLRDCPCTATLTDHSDEDSRYVAWEFDDRACPEHNPRGPIETYYDHGHWHAIRREHHDGTPDSGINGCIGTSQRTKAEAIAELLECEDAQEEVRAARRAA